MINSSTLTSKGQVTVPAEIRKTLGLHQGDELEFSLRDDLIILTKREKNVEAAFGLCKARKTASLEDMEKAIRSKAGK